jgi:hypothetical protein
VPDQIGEQLMSLWRNVRGEVAGAWRSIGYDLGRRPVRREPGPDVTSTGMSTFGSSLVDLPSGTPETGARPPRRFVAVAAFCALAAGGAAGSYLVATTAFADRMSDTTIAAAAPPDRIAPQDETGRGGTAGMGRTPQGQGRQRPAAAPGGSTAKAPGAVAQPQVAATRPATRPNPGRTTGAAAPPLTPDPECDCETPPVPTPTAPAAPSATVSLSASPTATGSPSPSATGSASPTPDDAAPSADSDRRHHRRRH